MALIFCDTRSVFIGMLLGAIISSNVALAQQNYVPGIWVDPDGCRHWIIDDGVEGYLSQRLLRNGKPLCLDDFTPNVASGSFKDGETFIGDLL